MLTPLLEAAGEFGVEALTLYAFSTENWSRSEDEVDSLMTLFLETAKRKVPELNQRGARLRFLGRRWRLPREVQKAIWEAEDLTRENEKLDVYIALNYGGRAELVDAACRMIEDGLTSDKVDEATFASYLYAPEVPDVDLLRAGGARGGPRDPDER